MTTLLLTRGSDPRAVEARRCGAAARLLVRARSFHLDQALARGASPDSSVTLSLRAHALISRAHRLNVARELRRVASAAGRPHHPFDPSVPVPHRVLLARDLIDEVAETLEGAGAVDARGVAQLEILLRDGGGPLLGDGAAPALRCSLEHILDALTVSPTIAADA